MRPTWEHSAVAALTTVVTAGLLILPGRVLGPEHTVGLTFHLSSPAPTRQTVEAAPAPRAHVVARKSPRQSLRTSTAQFASVVVPARPPSVVRHVVTPKAVPQHHPVSAVRPQRPIHRTPPEPVPVPAPTPPAPAPAPGAGPAVVTPVAEPTATTTRVLAESLTPTVEATPPVANDDKHGKTSHNDTSAHGSDNASNGQGEEHGNGNGNSNDGGPCDDGGHGHGPGSHKK
jgi:hypothetical protein